LKGFGGFGFAEHAEKPKFNDLRSAWVQRLKASQRLMDSQQTLVYVDGSPVGFQKGNLENTPASLLAMQTAGMVHENPPQVLRCHRVEMSAIFPINRFGPADSKIRFMDTAVVCNVFSPCSRRISREAFRCNSA